MELNEAYLSDPFLSLDDDLDDVSAVIRNNMIGERANIKGFQKSIFDESRTPSPQYLHDSEVFILQQSQRAVHVKQFDDDGRKEKEIGQIVSLLQDDVMLGSSSNHHYVREQHAQTHHHHHHHHHHPRTHNNQNQYQQRYRNDLNHQRSMQYSEFQHHNSNDYHMQHNPNQHHQYFVDASAGDVNFGATVSSDSNANSPLGSGHIDAQFQHQHSEYNNNSHQSTFFDTGLPRADQILSPVANSTPSNGGSENFSNTLQPIHSQFTVEQKVQHNMYNSEYISGASRISNVPDEEMLICGMENGGIIETNDTMMHSGFSDEVIHFGSTGTTTISSPSLSDVIFSNGTNANGALFEASPPPASSITTTELKNNSVGSNLGQDVANDFMLLRTTSMSSAEGMEHFMHHQTYEAVNNSQQLAPLTSMQYVKREILLAPTNASSSIESNAIVSDSNESCVPNVESSNNTKTELIRMLLEMTSTELENLRSSRNNNYSNYNASHCGMQKTTSMSSSSIPPLDPPPPQSFLHLPAQVVKPEKKRSLSNVRRKPSKKLSLNFEMSTNETGRGMPNTNMPTDLLNSTLSSPTEQLSLGSMFNGNTVSAAHLNSNSLFTNSKKATLKYRKDFAEFDESDETDIEASTTPSLSQQSSQAQTSVPVSPTKKGAKTERRTAHNLIEKKYRCSINDRINYLKEMLASDESKLSKSATLRKAIEHIYALRTQNEELTRENNHLRVALESAGIQVPSSPPLQSFISQQNITKEQILLQNPKIEHFTTSRESSESPLLPTSSTTNGSSSTTSLKSLSANTKQTAKKLLSQKSRVSLCAFMFVMVVFNPVSIFLASDQSPQNEITFEYDQRNEINYNPQNIPVYSHHRTLRSIADDSSPFDDVVNSNLDGNDFKISTSFWFQDALIRRGFVWLLNTLIVVFGLMRLLIYGEPVADGRSALWNTFIATKKIATRAIALRNYREAQRQLSDLLQILERPLPTTGGFEEAMSVTWQIIRHVLNGVWIGRWLARRRRSATQSVYAVCRSHAATSLVYHQLHQLHLMGVNGIEMSGLGGLNLALAAVNLAESAGISCDGISHRLRAELYINAALRVKLILPTFFSSLAYAYFLRRARRHVRKAQIIDGTDVRTLQWIFHPIGQKFLTSDINLLKDVVQNSKQTLNFPFSETYISPKPIDCLTSAFKMYLLTDLMKQLSTLTTLHSGSFSDFVEKSHLLLDICTSQNSALIASSNISSNNISNPLGKKDLCMLDWSTETDNTSAGDELCTWWTHLITCGLYWQYGDNLHAQKHYALVRKCPAKLLKNDLALSMGLSFCTRKMCFDDRTKRNFTDMVWMHAQRSFFHLEKYNFPKIICKNSSVVLTIEKLTRSITYDWLMTSILDIWNYQLTEGRPCWTQCAPNPMRQLYNSAFNQFSMLGADFVNQKKILAFKLLGRVLTGANPTITWRMLRALFSGEKNTSVLASTFASSPKILSEKATKFLTQKFSTYDSLLYFQFAVLQRLRKDFCNNYNLILD